MDTLCESKYSRIVRYTALLRIIESICTQNRQPMNQNIVGVFTKRQVRLGPPFLYSDVHCGLEL